MHHCRTVYKYKNTQYYIVCELFIYNSIKHVCFDRPETRKYIMKLTDIIWSTEAVLMSFSSMRYIYNENLIRLDWICECIAEKRIYYIYIYTYIPIEKEGKTEKPTKTACKAFWNKKIKFTFSQDVFFMELARIDFSHVGMFI